LPSSKERKRTRPFLLPKTESLAKKKDVELEIVAQSHRESGRDKKKREKKRRTSACLSVLPRGGAESPRSMARDEEERDDFFNAAPFGWGRIEKIQQLRHLSIAQSTCKAGGGREKGPSTDHEKRKGRVCADRGVRSTTPEVKEGEIKKKKKSMSIVRSKREKKHFLLILRGSDLM